MQKKSSLYKPEVNFSFSDVFSEIDLSLKGFSRAMDEKRNSAFQLLICAGSCHLLSRATLSAYVCSRSVGTKHYT